jgi:hypothetical protein
VLENSRLHRDALSDSPKDFTRVSAPTHGSHDIVGVSVSNAISGDAGEIREVIDRRPPFNFPRPSRSSTRC